MLCTMMSGPNGLSWAVRMSSTISRRSSMQTIVVIRAGAAETQTEMRKVIAVEWLTLDGVAQAPGAPDEDTTGGFKYGGWHLQYFDDMSRKWMVDNLTEAGGYLLGRRTYEGFAAHWPNASTE